MSKSKKTIQNNNNHNHHYHHMHASHNNNNSRPSSSSSVAVAASTAAPTPASSHSLSSPSPSPQPTTPVDQHSLTDHNCSSCTSSKQPIRIPDVPNVQNAHSASRDPAFEEFEFLGPCDNDINFSIGADMTTGPALDSAIGRSRQDSFVSAGPKPISMTNPNRDHANRGRRESLAGSLMNGMSWGGLSVGSFIRDE
jgi:transcription factor SFP1